METNRVGRSPARQQRRQWAGSRKQTTSHQSSNDCAWQSETHLGAAHVPCLSASDSQSNLVPGSTTEGELVDESHNPECSGKPGCGHGRSRTKRARVSTRTTCQRRRRPPLCGGPSCDGTLAHQEGGMRPEIWCTGASRDQDGDWPLALTGRGPCGLGPDASESWRRGRGVAVIRDALFQESSQEVEPGGKVHGRPGRCAGHWPHPPTVLFEPRGEPDPKSRIGVFDGGQDWQGTCCCKKKLSPEPRLERSCKVVSGFGSWCVDSPRLREARSTQPRPGCRSRDRANLRRRLQARDLGPGDRWKSRCTDRQANQATVHRPCLAELPGFKAAGSTSVSCQSSQNLAEILVDRLLAVESDPHQGKSSFNLCLLRSAPFPPSQSPLAAQR